MPEANRIVTRAQWKFPGFKYGAPPAKLITNNVVAIMAHYEGASPVGNQRGASMMRALNKFFTSGARGNGDDYIAVAYNYVIDQNGTIFEGRGTYQGGHCTNWNTRSIGVQIHIGGDEVPSDAALSSFVWLRAHLRKTFPKMTRAMTHSDGIPTECPGKHITAWVRAGMPDPINQKEDDMPLTNADIKKIWTTDNILPNPVAGQGVDAKNTHWTANNIIGYAARHSLLAERGTASNTKQIAELSGQLAGLKEAVGKIVTGQPVNLDDVDAAARKAAGEVVTAAFKAAAEAAQGEVQ